MSIIVDPSQEQNVAGEALGVLPGPGSYRPWPGPAAASIPVGQSAVTITIASPGVVTWDAHGLVLNDPVVFSTTGALPTGLTAGTTYYVIPTVTATVTITIASPAVVTWTNHGLLPGDEVTFSTTGALPTGITAATPYYVLSSGLTTNAFEFSATLNGAAVDTSGSQSGTQSATGPSTNTFKVSATVSGSAVNTSGSQSGTQTATYIGT